MVGPFLSWGDSFYPRFIRSFNSLWREKRGSTSGCDGCHTGMRLPSLRLRRLRTEIAFVKGQSSDHSLP